ncbi:ribosomal protein S18 acetylase RimI-like enzyme [Virgibacillus halotolerans]|uniref:GNAT family N-acetyltransferase n=1 Tax=Virgibacillus halotolerans TaxID=1071053 RepID=UPI001960D897|nr:N-acetyltransferase [Virgibacillus halotolerans]MBM7601532.1 ribosomal protein S18 acetylase RimI-like enzyme [Virgibacillus halotolerans]
MDINPPVNVRLLADFLEEMNTQGKYHIGFCGENSSEIYDTLVNDFSDLELDESFIVAYNNFDIIGAIGLDVDLSRGYADVWGPFIREENMELASKLWEKLIQKVPREVKSLSFFINKGNKFAKNFALQNEGIDQGSDLVLKLTKDNYKSKTVNLDHFNDKYHKSFSKLHNEIFPNTYFDANTILSRLNDNNQLILAKENDFNIKGYVYIEANPKHMEGNIEYVGVSKDFRRQGIGKTLITCALNQLFSYQRIEEITICVGEDNISAVELYRSVGFEAKYNLISYDVALSTSII